MGIELPVRRHTNARHLSDLTPQDFIRQIRAFILCISVTDKKFAYSVNDLISIGHSFGLRPCAVSLMVAYLQRLNVIEYQHHLLVGKVIRWNRRTRKPVDKVASSVSRHIIATFATMHGPHQ